MTSTNPISQRSFLLLSGITLLGSLLRFYNYSDLTLFNDELSAITRLRYTNLSELIQLGVMPDMHPAGVQVFLFILTRLFGNSEAVIRLPFVLAGIASIPLLFLIGKRWFNETAGLTSAAALAVLQFPVYYSQMARPYSLGLFTCLLVLWFFTLIIDTNNTSEKVRTGVFAGFVLAGAACMYIHYFSFLFAGLVGLTGVFMVPRVLLKKYLLSGILMVLLALPHWPVYKHQLLVGGLGGPGGWLGPPDEDTFRKYLFYLVNESYLVAFLVWGIGIGSFVYYRKTLSLKKYHLLCLLFFLMPFLVAYYYSIWKNPVLQYSILIFSFPCFLLFLFSFLPDLYEFRKKLFLVLLILLVGCGSTVVEKRYYQTEHYAVFRQLAERTIELNNTYGDQNITNTFNVYDPYYMNYYFEKFKRPVSAAQYRCMEPEKLIVFRDLVMKSTTPYFLHAWSNIYEPLEIEEIIRQQYPNLVVHDEHFNSGLSFFSRKPTDSSSVEKFIFAASHDFENFRWTNDQVFMSQKHVHSGNYSANLGGQEYGNTFRTKLKNVGYQGSCVLSVSCWLYSEESDTGAQFVVTVTQQNKTLFWQSGKFNAFNPIPGQWKQFFLTCSLPAGMDENANLLVFPWNINKKKIWMDDLEINLKNNKLSSTLHTR